MFDTRIMPRGHAESPFAVSDIRVPFLKSPKPGTSEGVFVIECRWGNGFGWHLHSSEFFTSEEKATAEAGKLQQQAGVAAMGVSRWFRVTRLTLANEAGG